VLEETVVEAEGVVECVHLAVVEHADPVVQLGNVDPSICSRSMRHFRPSISASGLVRLGRAEVEVGATVTTEPMKFVAVTTTA
jgi:hypothetical protein